MTAEDRPSDRDVDAEGGMICPTRRQRQWLGATWDGAWRLYPGAASRCRPDKAYRVRAGPHRARIDGTALTKHVQCFGDHNGRRCVLFALGLPYKVMPPWERQARQTCLFKLRLAITRNMGPAPRRLPPVTAAHRPDANEGPTRAKWRESKCGRDVPKKGRAHEPTRLSAASKTRREAGGTLDECAELGHSGLDVDGDEVDVAEMNGDRRAVDREACGLEDAGAAWWWWEEERCRASENQSAMMGGELAETHVERSRPVATEVDAPRLHGGCTPLRPPVPTYPLSPRPRNAVISAFTISRGANDHSKDPTKSPPPNRGAIKEICVMRMLGWTSLSNYRNNLQQDNYRYIHVSRQS
ncbi:hypothetical protein FB451DRAFT_1178480 [Mycena latifolia]|nr:hypothetical protein FB451DRAFT_1178480 [Mycena latifolia]